MAEKKYVYAFKDAHGLGKELLGGKGAGLAEMTYIGIPIPQGFTVTTEACTLYYDSDKSFCPFRCSCFYARYDGYNLEPWFK